MGLFDLGYESVELIDGIVEGSSAVVDEGDELVAFLGDFFEGVVLVRAFPVQSTNSSAHFPNSRFPPTMPPAAR